MAKASRRRMAEYRVEKAQMRTDPEFHAQERARARELRSERLKADPGYAEAERLRHKLMRAQRREAAGLPPFVAKVRKVKPDSEELSTKAKRSKRSNRRGDKGVVQ